MRDFNEGGAGAGYVVERSEGYPIEGMRGRGLHVVDESHVRVMNYVLLGLQSFVDFVGIGRGKCLPDFDTV